MPEARIAQQHGAIDGAQAHRIVADMDLVKREDFDALREQVQLQDSEIKALRAEIDSLKAPKAP